MANCPILKAIGIAFAIITCGPTSGGHFNPAITLCFAIWQGYVKSDLELDQLD